MGSSKTVMRVVKNIRRNWSAYAYEFFWANFPTIFYKTCPNILQFTPRVIQLEVTTVCNLCCRMCFNQGKDFKMKHMPIETYKKVIRQALPHLETALIWGVGEPLTNPNFIDMVKIAKKAGLEVIFSTNGMLLDTDMAKKIVRLRVDEIIFSIDGARPETFEKIRLGAKFEKVIYNVRELMRIKKEFHSNLPRISFTCALQRDNLVEMPEIVELAHRLGIPRVWFQNLISWNEFTRDLSLLAMDNGFVKRIFDKTKRLADQKGVKVRLPRLEVEGRSVCKFPWFGPPNIRWDGAVSLCPWIGYPIDMHFILKNGAVAQERTFFDPLVMGNINNSSLREIWNNRKYQQTRELFKQKQLPNPCDLCLHQYQVIC